MQCKGHPKSFPKLNHLFQVSKTGMLAEYMQIQMTFPKPVLAYLTAWLKSKTKK